MITPPVKSLIHRLLHHFGYIFPDKLYISIMYWLTFNNRLDWKHPLTFNEKLNWLKLNFRNKKCVHVVDKESVKEYVANTIGEQFVIPTFKEWTNPDSITIDDLPNKFVLKTNHDSGTVFICNDKENFNLNEIKEKLKYSMALDFSKKYREWPYKEVPRKIIAERLLESDDNSDLKDYKFFCFNGIPKFLKVDFNRNTNHQANYYTLSWNILPFGETCCPPNPNYRIEKPENFNLMIDLAAKLAADFPFVRVDFYNLNGKIYFGEMTLFPAAGFGHFTPEKADEEIGHLLDLTHIKPLK